MAFDDGVAVVLWSNYFCLRGVQSFPREERLRKKVMRLCIRSYLKLS